MKVDGFWLVYIVAVATRLVAYAAYEALRWRLMAASKSQAIDSNRVALLLKCIHAPLAITALLMALAWKLGAASLPLYFLFVVQIYLAFRFQPYTSRDKAGDLNIRIRSCYKLAGLFAVEILVSALVFYLG